MLERAKQILATNKWLNAQNKVNKAVKVLVNNGLSYDLEKGIQGKYKHLAKRETRKIEAAGKNNGYITSWLLFKNK